MTYIGKSVKRIEDPPLLTGASRFAADLSLPGEAHMRVVRSSVAHGRIIDIDVDQARSLPGTIAVWTGQDVADVPPIDFRMTPVPGLTPYRQPILAKTIVRYVGEPVAVVFADDAYVAEDAAELVSVDVEDLEAITDARSDPGAFDEEHSTEAAVIEQSTGDVAGAFAGAHAVVDLELTVGRHSGVPLETRGALARYDPITERLEVFGAAKVPHYNRNASMPI